MREGPIIALIVAMARNRVIGRDGGMPWRLPSDLRHFRATTLGKPMIMGRRTWDSLGRPLDGRDHLVVSRSTSVKGSGCEVFTHLSTAVARARTLATSRGACEIMVIGGGEIYRLALPYANRVYLTEVDAVVDGDTTFPELDRSAWAEVSRVPLTKTDKDEHQCTVVVLERRRPVPHTLTQGEGAPLRS